MPADQANENEEKTLHESFRTYRNSAVALSATLIAINLALASQLSAMSAFSQLAVVMVVSLLIGIGASLRLQYVHFKGQKELAHFFLERLLSGEADKGFARRHLDKSNDWFKKMYRPLDIALGATLVSLLLYAAFLLCQFR